MSKAAEHAPACDARWEGQAITNKNNRENFIDIFKRLGALEIKVAVWSALGGALGALLGKLF